MLRGDVVCCAGCSRILLAVAVARCCVGAVAVLWRCCDAVAVLRQSCLLSCGARAAAVGGAGPTGREGLAAHCSVAFALMPCHASHWRITFRKAPPAVPLAPQGLADPSSLPVTLAMAPSVAPMTKEGTDVEMQGAQGHRYPVHVMPASHRPTWGHNATEAIGFDLSPGVGGDMLETWGFGNRLFMYAALVIRANEISQPIIPILVRDSRLALGIPPLPGCSFVERLLRACARSRERTFIFFLSCC